METLSDDVRKNLVLADEPFMDAKQVSAFARFATKTVNLIKRGGRAAAIFVGSFLVVKALDKAAETHPDNKLINGADKIANVLFGIESMAVGGAVLIGEAGYDAITKPPVVLPPEKPVLLNDVPKPEHKLHRSRANLGVALAPPTKAPKKSAPNILVLDA